MNCRTGRISGPTKAFAGRYQRRQRCAAEFGSLFEDHLWYLGVKRPERATKRVQHPQLELFARLIRDVFEPCVTDELRELLDSGSRALMCGWP